MGEGESEPVQGEQPKKSRHRKKNLYKTILQQMEFYFSDSNLTKDRFLSQILAEDSCIDIEVFFKFNKIRKLNCTKEDLQKALKKSDIIELSEDGEKLSRKHPIKVKDNVDLCTIYVENIKADATHDSLVQIFSEFGNVVYVSIPKYKHNKMVNKGFAFIEFEKEEEAKEAVAFFESIDCKISSDISPEALRSIITFEGDASDSKEEKNAEAEENKEENSKKRKLSNEEESRKKPKLEEEKAASNEGEEATQEEGKKKKKNKKDKRKNYIKELGLQVLSKKEWKKLRNHYLDLQRKKMKEFKQYLHKQKFGPKPYNKNYDEEEFKVPEESEEQPSKLQYIPGVIVKLTLPEPCMDVKKLKNELKGASQEVKYVDIPLPAGSEQVFIRFSTSEAASEFCEKDFVGEKTLLNGEEEQSYWEKIKIDREVQFKKMAKKQRGREKLLKRAEKESAKHLRFEENDSL